MKRYGSLLIVTMLAYSSVALAAFKDAVPITDDSTFDGPGLIHCQVGHKCTFQTVEECKGPSLIHCAVGEGCTHKCEETAASAKHGNRTAASVKKTDDNQ